MARKKKKDWVFTAGRKESIRKARREHERLVQLGRRVRDSRK